MQRRRPYWKCAEKKRAGFALARLIHALIEYYAKMTSCGLQKAPMFSLVRPSSAVS
jgi:hypothetical protein